jgi:hypothetical protein
VLWNFPFRTFFESLPSSIFIIWPATDVHFRQNYESLNITIVKRGAVMVITLLPVTLKSRPGQVVLPEASCDSSESLFMRTVTSPIWTVCAALHLLIYVLQSPCHSKICRNISY